jgi:hypothetical protein
MTGEEFEEIYDVIVDSMFDDCRLMTLMIPGPAGVHVVQSKIPSSALQYAYDPDERGRDTFAIKSMVAACKEFGLPKAADE